MRLLVALLFWLLRTTFVSHGALALENLALRQQLATYARSQERPRLKPEERAFWVALSRVWRGWRSPLAFVKPETVLDWHRRGFRRYWRWRSRRPSWPAPWPVETWYVDFALSPEPAAARIALPYLVASS
jgi:hypothetical protein